MSQPASMAIIYPSPSGSPSVEPSSEVVPSVEQGTIIQNSPVNELFKTNTMVTVFVGGGDAPWVLSRDFLFQKMPSLRAKLETFARENPNGSSSDPIWLKKVEPPVFAMALDWFFEGKLHCAKPHPEDGCSSNDHFAVPCALHVFAEQHELPQLSAAAIDRIKKCLTLLQWVPTQTEIRYIFMETPKESVLRNIVVKETTKAFVSQPVGDVTERSEQWAELLACHPEFHARMLAAFKIQHASVHENARPLRTRGQRTPIRRQRRHLFSEVIDLTATEGSTV